MGRASCGSTFGWRNRVIHHRTAIFRQINKSTAAAHHDALEFPDGEIALLTLLCEGQQATVLQLPAEPKTAVEFEAERRCCPRELDAQVRWGHPAKRVARAATNRRLAHEH